MSNMVSELSFPTLPAGFNITHAFSDKLDRHSYLSWRAQFQAILAIHELSFILDASAPIPAPLLDNQNPNPTFTVWKKIDTLVLSWIRATASSSIQPLLFPCESAIEAWTTLEKRFSPNSRVHIKTLRERLRNLQKDATTSMLDYLLNAKSYADELASTGNPIPDSELTEFITDGLGPEYRGLISALALQSNTSFDDLFDILLHEESLLNRHSSSSSSTAFSTFLQPHKGQRNGNHNRGRNNRSRWRARGACQISYPLSFLLPLHLSSQEKPVKFAIPMAILLVFAITDTIMLTTLNSVTPCPLFHYLTPVTAIGA